MRYFYLIPKYLRLSCLILAYSFCLSPSWAQKTPSNLRIVTLSPHLAELVSELGLQNQIVGVSAHTNFPDSLRNKPVIADALSINLEQLKTLRPDVVLIWRSGTPQNQKNAVHKLFDHSSTQIVESDARTLDQIADEFERLGKILHQEPSATTISKKLREQIHQIKVTNQRKIPLKVFYQAWSNPLITIHRKHLIGNMINTCGGILIFDDQQLLATTVSPEQVLSYNPDVIMTAFDGNKNQVDWSAWKKYPKLSVNQLQGYLAIEGDLLTRPTSRALLATQKICAFFDEVRIRQRSTGEREPSAPKS